MPSDVLDLKVLVTNPATGETRRYERVVEMKLPGGVPDVETSAWYPLSQPFELAPGSYQARIAVRDRKQRPRRLRHARLRGARRGTG